MKQYVALHPEALNERVDDPIVVTGFPRSGTTLLHRSLTRTKHFQFLTLRETLYPMIPETSLFHLCSQYLFSKLKSIHDCNLDSPEEETILMDMCFASQLTSAMYNVPRYSELLRTLGNLKGHLFQLETYQFLKTVLQVHQHRTPQAVRKRWLLKSPTHIDSLPTLMVHFPNAQVVFCKRDLYQCLLSTISATAHARRVFSDSVDVARVSSYWCDKFTSMYQKQVNGECHLHWVEYEDLVSSTDCVLAELQRRLGFVPTQWLAEKIEAIKSDHRYQAEHLHLPKYLPFLPVRVVTDCKDSDSEKSESP